MYCIDHTKTGKADEKTNAHVLRFDDQLAAVEWMHLGCGHIRRLGWCSYVN